LLAELDVLVRTGFPVLLGTSRKRFLGALLATADGSPEGELVPVGDRLAGSVATATWAMWHGAGMVRAHDVRGTVLAAEAVARRRELEHERSSGT
jgi:dihydropteroate synthase